MKTSENEASVERRARGERVRGIHKPQGMVEGQLQAILENCTGSVKLAGQLAGAEKQ
jgi:hypothetical protein